MEFKEPLKNVFLKGESFCGSRISSQSGRSSSRDKTAMLLRKRHLRKPIWEIEEQFKRSRKRRNSGKFFKVKARQKMI